MRRGFLLACALAACVARAETVQEQMQKLFEERVEIYFKTEELRRKVEAAVFDPAVTSDAIAAARKALEQARMAYMLANAEVAALEREEKEVPQESRDAVDAAVEEINAAQARHREAVMEHPKVKELADELAKVDARAEVIRVEYEALREKQDAQAE